MNQSLFPRLPQNSGTQLLQFKAGKVKTETLTNGKLLISPDLRKGSITLVRATDSTLHFRWIDRITNNVVDDFTILPNETTFSKVTTGRENDRVYILRWKNVTTGTVSTSSSNSSRYCMFWMQQLDKSGDDENVKKVNEFLNQAPLEPAQNQLMQMLG